MKPARIDLYFPAPPFTVHSIVRYGDALGNVENHNPVFGALCCSMGIEGAALLETPGAPYRSHMT